jgi:Zn finger protein HypA/HybF involved in hydrogenase expression
MFGKTKKQIEELSRRVRSLEKDNCTLFSHIHEHRRVLYCHDCQRYPATDELSTAFCKVCEDACFRLKLKVESDVPKKTCLNDMDLFKK